MLLRTAGSRVSAIPPDVVGLAVGFGLAFYFWARVIHLFPQVEFIDWLAFPAGRLLRTGVREMVTFSAGSFSRHVSLIYASGVGRVCGVDITCVNTMAFLPIFGGVPAIYGLARVAGLKAAAATAIVAVWLVSEPMFDVMAWQATLLDRLATFFAPAVLLLVILAVRHARPGVVPIATRAVGLSVLALVAINTKEAAWILLPMMALAPVLLVRDLRQAKLAALTLAAPVAVTAVHIATVMNALASDPVLREHVSSGSISHNLPILTRYAVPGGLGVLIGLAVVGLACVALSVRARRSSPEAFALARTAVWMGVGAAASWVIPVRTQYPSPFYMFLPLVVAAIALALSLRAAALVLSGGERPRLLRYGAVAVGVALTGWFVGNATFARWGHYGDWFRLEASFRSSLPQIAALRTEHRRYQIEFYAAPEMFSAYRFMTASPARDFWRFTGVATPVDNAYPITLQTTANCGWNRSVVIRLDDLLRPTGVCPK
jgi:hypothetical protein